MREFFIVLKFELETMLHKKSFVISTVLVALSAFVILSLPRFFSNDQDTTETIDPSEMKQMMIYDANHVLSNEELLQEHFPEYQVRFVKSSEEVQDGIESGEVDAGFEVKDATNFIYFVKNSSMSDMTSTRIEQLMQQQYQFTQLAQLNYDVAQINAIYHTPIQSETTVLGTDGSSNYFYTYAMIMILYMMILIYGNQIGVGVASEKSNRAIEILTTSCSPNALIFGKVIAGAVIGVVQTAIMLGSFLVAYQMNAGAWNHMLDRFLQIPSLVLWTFALFGILGYLLFSFLFGAIGAMCSKVEEVNGATMPVQLFIIAVFMISFITLSTPDSLLAKIVSFVPFTSWMCMFINVAVGSASMVEIIISLVILALTTLGMGLLGAKLYRRGTLSYGNSVKFSHMIKMITRKE